MHETKNKTLAILIALVLTTSIGASIAIQPTVSAHTPPWTIISYAYLSVQPTPIGVGQTAAVCMWVDAALPGASEYPVTSYTNNIRRVGYTLTITAPDGTVSTKTWDMVSDPTGVQSYYFSPTQVGTYTLLFSYPGQTYTWTSSTQGANTAYTGDIYLAANTTKTLTVQQDLIPLAVDSYPLPTEYWTYPIEGQNNYWYTIASNWLGTPFVLGAGAASPGATQQFGPAPNSPHVMWTRPVGYGGIVGGNDTGVPGEAFYGGLSYNTRFNSPLIMQGVLYYQEPYGNSGTGGPYVAIDLKTGQQLWSINASATGVSLVPSFGYLYSMDQPNQHGVLPNGLLIASTTAYTGLGTVWRGYDPATGILTTMNVTNVPAGTNQAGPSGEYLKYVLTNYGTASSPNWYLAQWNSSNVFGTLNGAATSGVNNWYSGTANASLPSAYDWNVSVNLTPGSWSIGSSNGYPLLSLGNVALLIQGTFGGHVGDMGAVVTSDPANITAISLKPGAIGQVIWRQTYPQAPGNNTRLLSAWDPNNGVFIFVDKETFARWGYSLSTGSLLWGPVYPPSTPTDAWNFMIWTQDVCAYGNEYCSGYAGILYCWDDLMGQLKWTYGNGGEGNSTNAGFTTPYGAYPQFVAVIADGKIYMGANDHSPTSPMYKDAKLRCINATTGEEIWTISGWNNKMNGVEAAIASGYLAYLNTYDMQLYCYGKGPSQLTVTAPDVAVPSGTPLVIRGTVTDIAAGTNQKEQAARFPNGVAAVSDVSQSDWMEYVYMQKPCPTNITGVPISISVIDSNGNNRQIGSTTSDKSGTFAFTWTPDIPGDFTVNAAFAGSESYYPSSAETHFYANLGAPTASPTPIAEKSMADQYFIPAIAGLFVFMAIIGVAIILVLRKRP